MSSDLSKPPVDQNEAPGARDAAQATKSGAARSKAVIYSGIALLIISLFGFIYTFYPFHAPKTEPIHLIEFKAELQNEIQGSQPVSKLFPLTRSTTPESSREIPSHSSEQHPASAGYTAGNEQTVGGNLPSAGMVSANVEGQDNSNKPSNTSVLTTANTNQTPPQCPEISIECPKGDIQEGKAVTFNAIVGGRLDTIARSRLTYTWFVSPRKDFKGQSTQSISIDTGGLGEQTLSVGLSVGGIDKRCENVFRKGGQQCSVQIIKAQPPDTTIGRIVGRVEYPDGTGVDNVMVRATNRKTKIPRDSTTNKNGNFLISDLAAGTYDVSLPNSQLPSGSRPAEIGRQSPLANLTLVVPKPTPAISPSPSPSPTMSPSPTVSPSPTLSPTTSPSVSPPISPEPPASDLEQEAVGSIIVSWPTDLAKNWSGTIRASYIPPPGGKRPQDLVQGYAASAIIEFQGKGLEVVPSETGEKPLDDSPHEWLATVAPEDNARGKASCKVMIEFRLRNRETGQVRTVKRLLAETPLTVSTAPVTKNQSLGLSAGLGVMGLGLVGFGSRRRPKEIEPEVTGRKMKGGGGGGGGFFGAFGAGAAAPGGLRPATGDKKSAELPTAEPETPPYKQISAWITEREKEPRKPLRLEEPYTLNFKVGQSVAASLLTGPEARVPETDIPEEGLDTEWIVVSRTVQLWMTESSGNKLSVTSNLRNKTGFWTSSDARNKAVTWTAKFPLHIPKDGESEIVQLGITPRNAEQTGLDIYIRVDGELYRQLEVKFVVQEEEGIVPLRTDTDGEASHAGT